MTTFTIIQFHLYLNLLIISWANSNSLHNKNQDIKDLLRRKRYLLFPNPLDSETKVQVLFGLGLPMEGEVSMTLGYVLKCNYNLPYNSTDFIQPYVRYQRDIDEVRDNRPKPISRWELYRLLETALESLGSGKACLLRIVCEAAEAPFDRTRGLLGDLLHVLLTPSTTMEELQFYEDREYHAAEFIGRFSKSQCKSAFPECINSPLEYFTWSGWG